MNSYQVALERNITGADDAAIVTKLKLITAEAFSADSIRQWMLDGGHWEEGPQGFIGSLSDAFAAETTPAFVKRYTLIWRWLFSSRSLAAIRLDLEEASFAFNWLLNQISPALTTTQKNDFYRLRTGTDDRPFKALDVTQFDTDRTAYLAQVAAAEVAQGLQDWFTAQKFVVEEQIADGTLTTREQVAALISGAV